MFSADDLYPYEAIVDRPPIKFSNGARIAVWIAPNIEHFHLEAPIPEMPYPAPDVRNFARRDYGNRVAVWRMMEVMEKYKARGTVALNGEVALHYPRIMQASIDLGWEFMGHAMNNSQFLIGLEPDQEEANIAGTRQAIEKWGKKMHGWLSPALGETWHTLELLKKNGVSYVADWIHDDLPVKMSNGLYSIPYSLELNDMPLFDKPSISIQDFKQRICDAFDVLYAEGKTSPRTMCIALHPFLIGVPHRIKYFEEALAYIASHDEVWFATGNEIIEEIKGQ